MDWGIWLFGEGVVGYIRGPDLLTAKICLPCKRCNYESPKLTYARLKVHSPLSFQNPYASIHRLIDCQMYSRTGQNNANYKKMLVRCWLSILMDPISFYHEIAGGALSSRASHSSLEKTVNRGFLFRCAIFSCKLPTASYRPSVRYKFMVLKWNRLHFNVI